MLTSASGAELTVRTARDDIFNVNIGNGSYTYTSGVASGTSMGFFPVVDFSPAFAPGFLGTK